MFSGTTHKPQSASADPDSADSPFSSVIHSHFTYGHGACLFGVSRFCSNVVIMNLDGGCVLSRLFPASSPNPAKESNESWTPFSIQKNYWTMKKSMHKNNRLAEAPRQQGGELCDNLVKSCFEARSWYSAAPMVFRVDRTHARVKIGWYDGAAI